MISYKLLLAIGLIHWLADFALQTHWQASNKSDDMFALLKHVATYSLVWLLFSTIHFEHFGTGVVFAVITFVTHFAIDLITSHIVKQCFDEGDYHNGFVVIGFDQILHYVQLILTYELLK